MNIRIIDSINQFEPISLGQMEGIKLMDRIDRKYFFEEEKLHGLMEELREYYKVLQVNDNRACIYQTQYYDTNDLSFYLKHHNQHLNRYKIRKRVYADNGVSYFEIKYKNNKNRTIKERIKYKNDQGIIEGSAVAFLKEQTNLSPEDLIPTIQVLFTRCTFVNKTQAERVTMDFDLTFTKDNKEENFSGIVIVEAKQNKSVQSPFVRLLKKHHIIAGGVSKYCLGMALLNDQLKRNNFKSKILRFNKLKYDIASGY
ncbi:MAG TPA: polyphosphate polymerase domain-containing protein [Bacteroidia bacterium]|nr:polyphosphate polymerase domain-containing protein [Bacteroidia bacterium]HNT79990.1 polyphosphate polymerase domain-containing protein [Bacteroidia bacterium]